MESRFYKLRNLAEAELTEGNLSKAEQLASEYIALAAEFKQNWNFGNAIHHGHLILGRIYLQRNEVEQAQEYLLLAGQTPGSPQLNTFGPNMTLAKELLEKGKKGIVIEFLDLCERFWMMPQGKEKLVQWKSQILSDQIPEFGPNLIY